MTQDETLKYGRICASIIWTAATVFAVVAIASAIFRTLRWALA